MSLCGVGQSHLCSINVRTVSSLGSVTAELQEIFTKPLEGAGDDLDWKGQERPCRRNV
jgi:hypothetical protein